MIFSKRAFYFAKKAHEGQFRKDGITPYITHPENVFYTVSYHYIESTLSVSLFHIALEAALLHDVLEDTSTTKRQLEQIFGLSVACVVDELTSRYTKEKYPTLNRKERKRLELIRLSGVSSVAQFVKLADRYDNLKDGSNFKNGFRRTYVQESRELVSKIGGVSPALSQVVLCRADTF